MNRFLKYLPFILFFLFTFLYFNYYASHIFYYQEKSSLFILIAGYLQENLHQPGGLLVYLSSFLTALGFIKTAGALISASVLLLINIFSVRIVRNISGKDARLYPWLISLILFYLQCDYQFLFINNTGILLQLILFNLMIKKPGGWIPVVIIPFLYFFTGGFAIIFAVMFILWQILERPAGYLLRTASFIIISLLTYYISSQFIFFQNNRDLLTFPWSPGETGYQTIIFGIAVVVVCLLPVAAGIRKRNLLKIPDNKPVVLIAASVLLAAVLIITGFLRRDKKTFSYFTAEKLFTENRYQELIDFNLKNPSNNRLTIYLNNIALCETGRLNDLLFRFHQSPENGGTLFLKWEIVDEIVRTGGYFYYTTGMINEAQRWAYEYMVMKGLTPEGLKMLIKTEIINGNYKVAAKYNNMLLRTLFYRKEAKRYGRLLFNDAAVDSDPELGPKKRIKVKTDFFSITADPFINIERVVVTDPANRPAFDYMMAWLLLNKNYKGIAGGWKYLSRYNYPSIPVYIEEAGVALRTLYSSELPEMANIDVSAGTESRFRVFLQTFQNFGSNLRSAEPTLKKQFGDTFWYYVFYR